MNVVLHQNIKRFDGKTNMAWKFKDGILSQIP